MSRRPLAAALVLLALAAPASAIDVQSEVAVESTKSLTDYLDDLAGSSDPDRLFAARVLRGELRRALRAEQRAEPGSLRQLDAQSLLVDLDARLPGACSVAIRHLNAVIPCADIFALLGQRAALPLLREVRAGETRRRPQRHLDAAIAALEATPAEPPVPPASRAPPPQSPEPPSAPSESISLFSFYLSCTRSTALYSSLTDLVNDCDLQRG